MGSSPLKVKKQFKISNNTTCQEFLMLQKAVWNIFKDVWNVDDCKDASTFINWMRELDLKAVSCSRYAQCGQGLSV